MNWEIIVKRVNNGFVLSFFEETEDGTPRKQEIIFQDKSIDDELDSGQKEAFVDVCYELLDYFGLSGSKHDKKRLKISYTKDWDRE